MRPAAIFGTSTYAQVLHAYLHESKEYAVRGFTVERRYLSDPSLSGLPIVAFEDIAEEWPARDVVVFLGIGYNNVNASRKAIFERADAMGYTMPAYVHPSAQVHSTATLGRASVILENVVIQPYASLGDDTIVWAGSSILHHSQIAAHAFVAGGVTISGSCTISERAFIGAGAVLRDGITVGEASVIGAGVTLLEDTEPGAVYKAGSLEPLAITSDALARI